MNNLTFLESVGPNDLVSGNHIIALSEEIKTLKGSVETLMQVVNRQSVNAKQSVKVSITTIKSLQVMVKGFGEMESKFKFPPLSQKMKKVLVRQNHLAYDGQSIFPQFCNGFQENLVAERQEHLEMLENDDDLEVN